MRKKIIFGAFFILLMSGMAFADTIYLKNGKKISGEIYEDLGYAVKVKVKGSLKTYFEREIERVELSDPQKKISSGDKPQEKRSLDNIEEEKKELIRRFLAANGARDSMMTIFTQMMATLSPADQEKFRGVIVADKLITAVIPVYDRYFTEGELKEMIMFYSSPTGKKVAKQMPEVLEEAIKAAMEYFRAEIQEGQK